MKKSTHGRRKKQGMKKQSRGKNTKEQEQMAFSKKWGK
jgi:hypothetical protein